MILASIRWMAPFPNWGIQGASVTDQIKKNAKENNLKLREVAIGNATPRGSLVGTPVHIADELERFFRAGAVDGFILLGHVLPEGLDDFVEHVVPILQARGLFREEYEHTTLRGHLGLSIPNNRYTAADRG